MVPEEIIGLQRRDAAVDAHMEAFRSRCSVMVVCPNPMVLAPSLQGITEARQHLTDGMPPAGDACLLAARECALAKAALDEATANANTAKKQLIETIPAERRDVDGTKFEGGGACATHYSAQGTVDYAKVKLVLPSTSRAARQCVSWRTSREAQGP